MQDINDVVEARFGDAQLDPTPTMIKRMEILKAILKVLAPTAITAIPCLLTRQRSLCILFSQSASLDFSDETDLDLYLAFGLGHHNLIQYWLEARPLRRAPLPPPSIACSTHRSLSTMHRATGTHASPILKSRSGERLIFKG